MTKHQQSYQPGPIFHDAFLAGMRALGSSSREFADRHGVNFQNIRGYSTGWSNGPKAQLMRDAMIEEIGPDLFAALYAKRLEQERV
ncbi:hypothetical protein [Salipiger mucosus]|uniref:XRE family transcriptional regulator n=1 Tax=Salipiger mucosus DSM 16094 TaxID=1123237 RepID=S9Q9U7_9RHOB|nr:hypothetical protein [Salipiger mucosus]EPX78121.1 hypothetical protein Salmuc_04468 [Salipiger mucosus DSM 16094]